MHIMWELQTNKANFLFKNRQDFYETIHAAPHWAIVFSDNIILDFNYQVFVLQKVTQWHVTGVLYFRYFG